MDTLSSSKIEWRDEGRTRANPYSPVQTGLLYRRKKTLKIHNTKMKKSVYFGDLQKVGVRQEVAFFLERHTER